MFTSLFPELVYSRLEEDTRKQLETCSEVRRTIFEILTVGINVKSVEVYQNVAAWLLTVQEENLKKITLEDVEKGVGEYIDCTGYLV